MSFDSEVREIPLSAWLLRVAGVLVYLCLPRVYLEAIGADVTTRPLAPYLLLTVALVAGLAMVTSLTAAWSRRGAGFALCVAIQTLFALRALEAGLVGAFGFGYNALFFVHAGTEAIRIGFVDYRVPVVGSLALLLLASWPVLHAARVIASPLGPAARHVGIATAILALAALGVAVASPQARQTQASWAFVSAGAVYLSDEEEIVLDLSSHELEVLAELGIRLDDERRYPVVARVPESPPNLILILLESWQNNFTTRGGSKFEGLTPNLDRILSQMTWVSHAYNAVTPTIIAMTSIICGVLPPTRPLYVFEEIYSSLRCFPDLLHEAGYHQVFMGAAEKEFTYKGNFLAAHSYDEIYGDEDWRELDHLRKAKKSSWGIHDTHLFREALDKLEALKESPPFHLTLLTINSHKPGYRSPFCPVYEMGNRYLNGIHCTDFAMGRLWEGIEEMGLLENTVVVMVGDHMAFPIPDTIRDLGEDVSNNYFGNVFMAIHSPHRDLEEEIDTPMHSPDVAATVLDLLGVELAVPFQLSKSLLGERRDLPHLIGPETEVFRGEFFPKKRRYLASEHCSDVLLEGARIERPDVLFTPCQRYRLVTRVDQWLRADEKTGAPPHPPVAGAIQR